MWTVAIDDVENWSKLVKIPFVGAYFCLAESRHCVTAEALTQRCTILKN